MNDTLLVSPRLPPYLLKLDRTSPAVRLRLFGQGLDDQRHAAGTVALVADLVVVGVGVAGSSRALIARSIVSRVMLFLARRDHGRPEARIGVRIGRAEPRRRGGL